MIGDPTIERLAAAIADRYRVDRSLGAGGMATVWQAHDLRHGRDVAIKVLHPDLGAALGGERFLTEISTTAKLQHPHILPLLESGEAAGLLYYVMPLVTGETLRARLARERQLPVTDALRLASEVASALDYAHRQGVIHRDIKPENILLQDGQAIVADFGIALAVQSAAGARMTQTGLSLGTPQYMSPEQAMGERNLDARTDVYALGAVVYEMLTGDPPFTGSSVQAIVAKVLAERPSALRTVRQAVPQAVERAVLCALEKLPADRFASAAEFARALERTSEHSVAASATPTGFRRPLVLIASAATIAIVAALAGRASVTGVGGGDEGKIPWTTSSILPVGSGTIAERASIALSPDGRKLAFVQVAPDGSRALWVRRLDVEEADSVRGSQGAEAPFWSPDDQTLGFFSAGRLRLSDARGDVRPYCPAGRVISATWGTANVIAFSDRSGITTLDVASGSCLNIVRATVAPDAYVSFLADGKRLIVSRISTEGQPYVVDLTGRRLDSLDATAAVAQFVAPDRLITFRFEQRTIESQRIDPTSLRPIGERVRLMSDVRNAGGIPTFTIAPSGALAFLKGTMDRPYLEYDARGLIIDTVRLEGTWTVATRPRAAGSPTVAVAGRIAGVFLYELDGDRPVRIPTAEGEWGVGPAFSADGSQLAFGLRGTRGGCGIQIHALAGGESRRIAVRSDVATFACEQVNGWTPDGRALLVRRDTAVLLVSVDSGRVIRDLIARPGRIYEAALSQDGRWIAYSSDETGRAEIYVEPFEGGARTRVTSRGGRWPQWSKNGRALYFVSAEGRVSVADVAPGSPPIVGTERTLFIPPNWRRSIFNDEGVGFAMVGDAERFIVRQSPAALAITYVQGWKSR